MSREQEQARLEGIEELQGRLELWRQGRKPGQRMPPELWSAAVELAGRHGVYPVARSLGLEFAKLKNLLEESGAPEAGGEQVRSKAGRPRRRMVGAEQIEAGGFVQVDAAELFGPPVHGGDSAVVDLFAVDGARMRISLSGRALVDLPALVSAFAGRS